MSNQPVITPAVRPNVNKRVRFGDTGLAGGIVIPDADCTKVVVPKAPVRPSEQEIEDHNACHIPFRSWCAFCVAGKAKCNPHFAKDECQPCDGNIVSMDYAFLGDKRVEDVSEDEEEDGESGVTPESKVTVLVMRDRKYKYVTASVVPRKGSHPYTVHRVGQDLTCVLGHKKVFLKTDQERAIKKLKAAVRKEYGLEIPDEYSCVGDSQSNGEVEITVQVVEGQVRTLKCQLEHRITHEVPVDHDNQRVQKS